MKTVKNSYNEFLTKAGTGIRPLVIKALPHVITGKNALEIGAGVLHDTKYLLKEGFSVVAVDPSELTPLEADKLNNSKLVIFNDIIENYNFPKNHFDFVTAQYSLMYIKAEFFNEVFNNITDSLVSGGILAIQLFGNENNLSWLAKNTLHHDLTTIEGLLKKYDVIFIKEFKNEIESISGIKGSSHDIRILAKKK